MTYTTSEKTLFTVQNLLYKHLQIEEEEREFIQNTKTLDELQAKLVALMQYLLQHDFERLVQGMYQIDVNEQKFKEVMQIPDLNLIADKLAELVMEREIQKAYFRQQYQS